MTGDPLLHGLWRNRIPPTIGQIAALRIRQQPAQGGQRFNRFLGNRNEPAPVVFDRFEELPCNPGGRTDREARVAQQQETPRCNAHPAEVFMGDVGSLALGGAIGTVAVIIKQELLLPFIGGVFVIEAVSVILQVGSYKLRKKRIFKMAPLHHHFELMGWSESKIIVRFWIASLVFALFALTTLKLR